MLLIDIQYANQFLPLQIVHFNIFLYIVSHCVCHHNVLLGFVVIILMVSYSSSPGHEAKVKNWHVKMIWTLDWEDANKVCDFV
jgi:hypothetical protein